MKEIRRLVFQLILLLIALFVLYLLVVFVPAFKASGLSGFFATTPPDIHEMEGKARIPPAMPKAKAGDEIAAQDPHGFQYVVSYVDSGFEPANITLKRGDVVRFVNNSTGKLWVAAGSSEGVLYPDIQNGCGSSALDSCEALSPGEYWQFTFTEKGTWSFQNNLDKSQRGVITVRAK